MKQFNLSLVLVLMLSFLSACNKSDNSSTADAVKTSSASVCELVSTIDNKPLPIKVADADTPEAKEFLSTCINPYTKKFAIDPEAAKTGRKVFTLNGCSGCHGGKLEGIMAPALTKAGGQGAFDTKWVYAKNETDKGMFETISAGTPGLSGGVMAKWNRNLEGHVGDGLTNDEILRVIAYIRTEYKGDGEKTWMK
ncbi:MAG: c-type cytochrome [Pseudomonadota bacterium]